MRRAAGTPWVYVAVGVVAAAGLLAVVATGSGGEEAEGPAVGDHWHAPYGVYLCGEFIGPLVDVEPDRTGIHTHGAGLVHIHPVFSPADGTNPTLGMFAATVGLGLSDIRLRLPGGPTYAEEVDRCDGSPAFVRVAVWDSPSDPEPTVVGEDVADIPLARDGQVFTIGFFPADSEIPKPPSIDELDDPSDV